jgi:acid stress-induced BolA-like protein IbaG/YrbA
MDIQAIETILETGMPGCELGIEAEGNKLGIRIVSEAFNGLSRVKRQQKIYALLDDRIKSGEIHAVSMVTLTPEEAAD